MKNKIVFYSTLYKRLEHVEIEIFTLPQIPETELLYFPTKSSSLWKVASVLINRNLISIISICEVIQTITVFT